MGGSNRCIAVPAHNNTAPNSQKRSYPRAQVLHLRYIGPSSPPQARARRSCFCGLR